MMKFISFIRTKYRNIFNGLLFVITIGLIVFMLPREGKFKYEFQKGKPWQHETLMAPYDFPVYKSQKQIKAERDSILDNTYPYFSFDSTAVTNQINRFRKDYKEQYNEFVKTLKEETTIPQWKLRRMERSSEKYESYIVQLLREVYKKGILVPSEITSGLNKESVIVILRNNVAEEISYDEVYNQKEAYKHVLNKSEAYLDTLQNKGMLKDESLKTFFNDYSFYDFVKPNLHYDRETTEKVKQSKLDNVSTTKGMVQAGERIISKGEVVDSQTYQIIESLRKEYEQKLGGSHQSSMILFGQIIFVFAAIFVLYLFLYHFREEILQNSLKSAFILLLVVLLFLVSSLTIRIRPEGVYLIPFAILAIMIRSFYDARLALFIHVITVLLVGFFAPNSFEFVFLNFIAGIVAIFSLTSLNRRGKLFLSAALVIISYSFVYFGLAITQEGNIRNIEWMNFAYFGINGAMVLAAYPLIYIFEKTFGFLSDVTLMELSDTNQPLLRQLSEKAPGTFQHSLQVANLAETAVYQIGGNSLLVRTGALYHDIGKMDSPIYFIENQSPDFNPHEQIDSEESARIIIGHVKRGVEVASKYKLPSPIVDFIRTHHGTTKVQYFYKKFLQNSPDDEIDDTQFTYPGPKPFSKEMAVLMMADSVEAASRSYNNLNEKIINNLVDNIIDNQLNEGQFENVDVTFRDITIIKGIFKKKLQNFYHARIKYPK